MYLQINRKSSEGIYFSKKSSEFYFEYKDYRLIIDSVKTDDQLQEKSSSLIDFIERVIDRTLSNDWMTSFIGGHYAIVLWNVNNFSTWLIRDIAGAKTIYYSIHRDVITVGNTLYDFKVPLSLNIEALRRRRKLRFFIDGDTFYHEISEVKMGNVVTFDESNMPIVLHNFGLKLLKYDSLDTTEESIKSLRQNIIDVHENMASNSNIVLLSGGIDSSVMLASLNEIKTAHMDLCAVTFKLKGTSEDETPYARDVAKRFGTKIETIEVDPNCESMVEKFETEVVQMNSPYHGALIYGYLPAGKDSSYFAGQDSRLHTPAMNWIDNLFFDSVEKRQFQSLLSSAKNKSGFLAKILFGASQSKHRSIRGLARLGYFSNPQEYVRKYMLEIGNYSSGIVDDEAMSKIKLFEEEITSQRDLYNQITTFRWGTQWTSDMHYLQDMAMINETNMCLPFYDVRFARFSSGLPFKKATAFDKGTSQFDSTKVEKVNKFFLREAFKTDLPLHLASRQKAVSRTLYLIFNGPLGQYIRDIVYKDSQKAKDSIALVLGYSKVATWFLNRRRFDPQDEKLLTDVFQLSCIIRMSNKHD
jgi:hypothetical protein